jgi:hypothetical protein
MRPDLEPVSSREQVAGIDLRGHVRAPVFVAREFLEVFIGDPVIAQHLPQPLLGPLGVPVQL